MRTPVGGHRSTQWLIQHRTKPTDDQTAPAADWVRWPVDPSYPMGVQASVRALLERLRTEIDYYEWRAIRIESVQRIEDW